MLPQMPRGLVSPGGIGFDINCGVRLLRTNLHIEQVKGKIREKLGSSLEEMIPVGIWEAGAVALNAGELDQVLKLGMDWAENKGLCWPQDKEVCEERGRFQNADPGKVSERAKKRGRPQAGSLGGGNHYVEVQAVDEIFNELAAKVMGIKRRGQVLVMIHTGSRGLGHQVATDAWSVCDKYSLGGKKVKLVDRQLACVPIHSKEGQDYVQAMAAAANFALCNRTIVANQVRLAFERTFNKSSEELDMHVIYAVSHNIAKFEEYEINGEKKEVLVHRKGATRAFPRGHPAVPKQYQDIGQPVLIGGSMGTASYILVGAQGAMEKSMESTCHGAGRSLSRTKAIKTIRSQDVLAKLAAQGIVVKVASKHLIAEEAPGAYKDVESVVETCEMAGISNRVAKLIPLAVVKG